MKNATGRAAIPPEGTLSRIARNASPANLVGTGNFHLQPYEHHTVRDGRNAHLPWAQSTPDPLTTVNLADLGRHKRNAGSGRWACARATW